MCLEGLPVVALLGAVSEYLAGLAVLPHHPPLGARLGVGLLLLLQGGRLQLYIITMTEAMFGMEHTQRIRKSLWISGGDLMK